MKSNIMPLTNIYQIKGQLMEDTEFRRHIRGKSAIVTMLRVMYGSVHSHRNFHIADVRHLLTPEQVMDFENGTSCYLLDDKAELVNGFVQDGDRLKSACRCYNYSCRHFHECRPGVSKEVVQVQIEETNSLLKRQKKQFSPAVLELLRVPMPADAISSKAQDEEYVVEFQESNYIGPTYESIEVNYHDTEADQEAIIHGAPADRMMVNAGPGTGKTYCLIEKIKFMVSNYDISPANNMLVLCFTNAAVNEVKKRFIRAIELNGWPDDLAYLDIRTFDSFATQMLIYNGADFDGKDYEERIQMAIDTIETEPGILENLEHLFVDEIQDLVGVRARFVKAIIENCNGGFTLLGDTLQGIYDYQIREQVGEMDSVEFRQWVQSKYTNLKNIGLSVNKRQSTSLSSFSSSARDLLESGAEGTLDEFFKLVDDVPSAGDIFNFTIDHHEDTKTAVLCRTNGDVLKLSGYLTERGIDHSVKTNSFDLKLPMWVGSLLLLEDESMSESEFVDWAKQWNLDNPKNVYQSLLSLMQNGPASVNLRDLKNLLASGRRLTDDIYAADDKPVLLTTIHQSKGREFDRVYVLKRGYDLPSEGHFDEAKVFYVAITRAKESLYTVESDDYRMKKKGIGRWVQTYKYRGDRISRIEVGVDGDVSEVGFVDLDIVAKADANQDYIVTEINVGDGILLKKNGKNYSIIHGERIIGCMSEDFNHLLREALQAVQGYFKRLPSGIDGLYVHTIYPVVRKPETLSEGVVPPFSVNGVWYGVQILGMGRIVW